VPNVLNNPIFYEDVTPTNIRLKTCVKEWLLEQREIQKRTMSDIINDLCERQMAKEELERGD